MNTGQDLITANIDMLRLDYLFTEVCRQIEKNEYTEPVKTRSTNTIAVDKEENAITIYGDGMWESVYIDENGYRELNHLNSKLGAIYATNDYELQQALILVRYLPERSYTVMLDQ